jgi:pyruvate,water dikinase
VAPELVHAPCLDAAQAREIAAATLALEAHFGTPQDVEWAQDRDGRLFILQARPLRAAHAQAPVPPPVPPGAEVLLAGGATACPGLGSGPVYHVLGVDDVAGFPQGAVLVARHSSPKYRRRPGPAGAVVADGTRRVTGHMAAWPASSAYPPCSGLGRPGGPGSGPGGHPWTPPGAGSMRGPRPKAGPERPRARRVHAGAWPEPRSTRPWPDWRN